MNRGSTLRRLTAILLLWSLGCGDETPPVPEWADESQWRSWHDCEDMTCREPIIRSIFQQDPELAAKWMAQVDTTEEQIALVKALVCENQAQAGQLCPAIEDPTARRTCEADTSRPHICARKPPSPQGQSAKRTALGPEQTTLILPPRTTQFSGLSAQSGSCGTGRESTDCLKEAARKLAEDGDAPGAAQRCMAIEDLTWKRECHFQAAETLAQTHPIDAYGEILDLCRGDMQQAGRCIDKVHTQLARRAPPANADAKAWTEVLAQTKAIRTSWRLDGPKLMERALDGYLGAVLYQSYSLVDSPTGAPLSHLPKEAISHIHAAAAWHLVSTSDASSDLNALRESLSAALDSRLTVEPPGPPSLSKTAKIEDLWPMDGPGDESIPATIYLGTARRAVSTDLQEDWENALEAAVRQGPQWDTLISEARKSPRPLVSWTAERLWTAIQSGDRKLMR